MSNTPGSCNLCDGTEEFRAAAVKRIAEMLQENGEVVPVDLGAMLFNWSQGDRQYTRVPFGLVAETP